MRRIFDVIEWADDTGREMARRFPEEGAGDFRLGSQLIVREGQVAVFFRDGKALDVFGPGRHTLTTANIPLLIHLLGPLFSFFTQLFQGMAGRPAGAPAALPEVLTVEEAAVYLKAPPEDVVRLVESGQLKARKIDTAYRISRAALEEFMKG